MEEEKQLKEFSEFSEKDIKYIKWDMSKKTMTRSTICQKWSISTETFFRVSNMSLTYGGYK